MRSITSTAALALAALALAVTPALALADRGDDDPGRDDHGGQRDDRGGDDDGGRRGGDDDGGRRGGRDDGEQRVAGSCTGRTTAKLKVKHDDGRIEAEFEVDQNRSGVTWTVRIRRNDSVVVKTRATTGGPSGSFSVERKIADPAGTDHIRARAVSPSGEVCTASASL